MNSSTVAGILERARASLGYEALRTLEGQLVLSGASERYGLAGRATLTLSPTGEFVDSFAGRVGMTVAFDGSAGWGLDMTAMPMGLDLDELETPRIVCGVLSGLWLREDGPFDVELDRAKTDEQTVGLKLSLRGGTVGASLHLDRTTWRPTRLERPLIGWERRWDFADYRTEGGVTLARTLVRTEGGVAGVDRFEALTVVRGEAARFRPVISEPDDARYDPSVEPRIALLKIDSGHVFVRPKIDGREVGWFALDTGSGAGFTILPRVADALDLPRFGRIAGGGAGTAVQIMSLRQGRTFELGPVTIVGSVYAELPDELNVTMKRLADIDVVGTCGYDLFRRFIVELDLARAEVILHPRDGGPQPDAWFDLKLQRGIPSLRCRFEGREGQFQIDTGAGPLVIFHSPAVEELKLLEDRHTETASIQGAAGSVESEVGKLAWIEIAGQRLPDVPALFVTGKMGALADPHTQGTLGGILLAPKRLVFDYRRRRMAVLD